jgi:GNAT superfamily N-acetyltransferase
MRSDRITFRQLTKDNILSFEDYIPDGLSVGILQSGAFGYGVLEDAMASGAVLAAEEGTDITEVPAGMSGKNCFIEWICIDRAIRGGGVGAALLSKVEEDALSRGAANILCRFPEEGCEELAGLFLSKDYELQYDTQPYDERGNKAFIAIRRQKETERAGLSAQTAMLLPRLNALSLYLTNMGYAPYTVMPEKDDGTEPYLLVERPDGLPAIFVAAHLIPEDPESAVITVSCPTGAKEGGSDDTVMTAVMSDADGTTMRISSMPADGGMCGEEEFKEFFAAFLEEAGE